MGLQVSQLWSRHLRTFKCVILEETLLDSTIWELHAAHAVLNTFIPLALVTGAIFPVHLTITMSLIVFIAAFVKIARLPCEHSHAVLLVVFVAALVHVAILVIKSLLPFSFTILQPIFEFSDVDATIFPFILS